MNQRWIRKGRPEPREGLAQQGKVSLGLAKEYEVELDHAGWPAAKTTALEQGVGGLETSVAAQAEARGEASGARNGERDALVKAKGFVRRLRKALPMVLRDASTGVTRSAFATGQALGLVTPRVSAYLTRIRPAVVKLDKALTPYFDGKKASVELDAVKAALDGADATQETARSGLPLDTLAVYEAKGQVLESIEDLNRVAAIAFDAQPEVLARFNKDVLDRARKERTKDAAKPRQESKTRAPAAVFTSSTADAKCAPDTASATGATGAASTAGTPPVVSAPDMSMDGG